LADSPETGRSTTPSIAYNLPQQHKKIFSGLLLATHRGRKLRKTNPAHVPDWQITGGAK
jgi:hypothetical protein